VVREGIERRLAAILSADVAGYSRLMNEDEAGTLAALKAHRAEFFDPTVAEYGGRIVKLMGDGSLVEFPSVVDAVECAVTIQHGMAERNAEVPEDRCIAFRIGINLGDIIVEGDDIYGDGVNIAARIQEIAVPGGVCISGDAYHQVRSKMDAAFEDLGEQEVKNIPEPVRVYRWTDAAADPIPGMVGAEGALPLPDKPSIAVLPFTNMSGDPEQQYFSDGITGDIITGLGRFRDLFVIADTSSFAYRDKGVAVQQVGRDLGVQHVLKGSVRAAGGKIRVSAQLVEAATGQSVWAESYDRVLDDVFAVQDEITQTIVATLVGRLEDAAHARALQESASTLSVYDHLLRGRHHLEQWSKDDVLKARAIFERALELDPNHAGTYIELAETYYAELQSHWSEAPDVAAERLFENARKAVALDDLDSRAHLALGRAYYRAKANYEFAEAQFETAIALNPNDVWNYCGKGFFLTCSGRLDEAVSCDNYAIRLNPLMPDACLYSIGVAH
jgi:TolB-like protein/class 3 adenylate cyclase